MLTGEIPSWLFNFKGLDHLYLGGNHLTWNNSLKIVPRCILVTLSLRSCALRGEVPDWISTQTRLNFLDLSENELQGTFPQWLAEMKVAYIILPDNRLTGSLPPALFHSHSLWLLALSKNNFSGELPKNIGDANSLSILMLAGNNFSGPIPPSTSQIPNLQVLDLSRNRFSGNTFPVFDPQGLLSYVDFSSNQLSGEVPTAFSQYTEILALGGNKFSGGLPSNLTKLSNLKRLELQDNYISGEFPNFLSQIFTLQVFNLQNNFLEGLIPETVSNLSNLQILDLSNNNLTGKIPLGFVHLMGMIEAPNLPSSYTSISTIYILYSEDIRSNIVLNDLIVNWNKSKQGLSSHDLDMYFLLDLSSNQLSGEIPDSLGTLKALKLLNISHNKLSGKIPASLGDLENLESLDLSHNQLSGSIPPTLTKLQQLTTFDVSNNQLTGQIPIGGQMNTMLDPNYYANNSGLCGAQIQVTCPEEQSPPSKPQEHNNKEPWFSWGGVGIGYPVGFVLQIVIIFLTGYFSPSRPSNNRLRCSCPHQSSRQRM